MFIWCGGACGRAGWAPGFDRPRQLQREPMGTDYVWVAEFGTAESLGTMVGRALHGVLPIHFDSPAGTDVRATSD